MLGSLVIAALLTVILIYAGRGPWNWWIAGGLLLALVWQMNGFVLSGLAVLILVFSVRPVRRALVSRYLFPIFSKMLPKMGETERIALEAGTVGWDAELFSGKPDWQKLLDFKCKELNEKEKAFLAGPVEQLCASLDDWQVM